MAKAMYRAWRFDPERFHDWLHSEIIVDGTFVPERLRELAMRVASDDDPAIADYLAFLRFEPKEPEDWARFFEDDGESVLTDEWYVIAMAEHLRPNPSISEWNWQTLERFLPLLGWSSKAASALVYGDDLQSLINKYGDDSLLAPVGRYLSGTAMGGWLAPWSIESFRSSLADLGDSPASRLPLELSEPAQQFSEAVVEARQMLATAAEDGSALRLLIDI